MLQQLKPKQVILKSTGSENNFSILMTKTINGGFWRRLGARLCDLLLVACITIPVSFLFTKRVNEVVTFLEPSYFYIWACFLWSVILIIMVGIPLLTKGQSPGYWVFGIKVKAKKIYQAILRREIFYGFAWSLIILLVIVVINHTLISQIMQIKGRVGLHGPKTLAHLSSFAQIRIAVVGAMAGLIGLAQMFLAITIIPNLKKQGWHDQMAQARVVLTRKVFEIDQKKASRILQAVKYQEIKYDWIERESNDE